MKYAILALIAQASAASWDSSAICDETMPKIAQSTKDSADACSSFCAGVDAATTTVGVMCCSYIGSTCSLYDAGATTSGTGSSYTFDHVESMADSAPTGVVAVPLGDFVTGVKAHLASAGCTNSCINAILSSPEDKTVEIGQYCGCDDTVYVDLSS